MSLNFIKKIDKKYYILMAVALFAYFAQTPANLALKFLLLTISHTILVPTFVIVFWDDFSTAFAKKTDKAPKVSKKGKIAIVLLVYFLLLNSKVFLQYKDIPVIISQNYTVVEDVILNQGYSRGRLPKQYFQMGETIYSVSARDFDTIEKGKKYKVTMLKNSKFIMDIEKTDN